MSPVPKQADVAVVGGGIIGSCCAYFLAKAGRRVAVFDAGEIGGATAAVSGSGVLCHTKNSPLVLTLTRRSMTLYEALRHEMGVPYEVVGSYVVYRTADEEQFVRDRVAWLTEQGVRIELLERGELMKRLPAFAPSVRGASYVPGDGSVQGRAGARSFADGAARLGGSVHPHLAVDEISVANGRVRGVVTRAGAVACSQVVLAAGPWAEPLAARVGVRLPVRLEKGETLVTAPVPVRLPGRVLSPRVLMAKFAHAARTPFSVGLAIGQDHDGAIRIGATREETAFDLTPSARARRALLDEFAQFFPSLASAPIREHAVGLRPAGPNKRPVVARCGDPEGLVLACAHGGDGIALAPITGLLVSQLIGGETAEFGHELGLPAESPAQPT